MTLEAIVEELKTLPESELERAADYIHRLHLESRTARKDARGKLAGSLSDEDVNDWQNAIEEGCSRVDARDW